MQSARTACAGWQRLLCIAVAQSLSVIAVDSSSAGDVIMPGVFAFGSKSCLGCGQPV
jgi:hypothetical protein